jgi:hypothetical protein
LPEGKSLFFRRAVEDPAPDVVDEDPKAVTPPAPKDTKTVDAEMSAHAVTTEREIESARTTRQSAIFLEERHLDWLEDKCREARQRGGRAIRKALIIRALLDVAMQSPVDLTALRKEEDLVERVRRGLRYS